LEMAAKRTLKKRDEGEHPSNLSAGRVLRALDGTLTAAQFWKKYEEAALPRGRQGPREPTPEEVKAFVAYQKTGDYAAFMKALGTDNSQTANAALRRVLEHQAKKG
jgi:hypothetical protein